MRAGPGDGSRAVAIGGGHGLSRSLDALARVVDHVTAVVTVADDGGSSGRLRRDLDVIAPGDLRMALATLARDRELADLVQYRFPRGELAGHSLGNLVLVALQDLAAGDVVDALDRMARVLDVPGRVLPCTTVPVTLHARVGDRELTGQVEVATTPRLEQVWLDPPSPPATAAVVAAVRRADLIVLGPGSLYTSLLPNLLVPGVARAVAAASCPVVLVANLREQPGETEGMTLDAHVAALLEHVPDVHIDVLLAHDGPDPSAGGIALRPSDTPPSGVGRIVTADLLDGRDGHEPVVLARCFEALLGPDR